MAKKRKPWTFCAGRRPHTVSVGELEPGGFLYVWVWIPGEQKHRYRSLRHRDRAKAMDYAEEMALKLRQGSDHVITEKPTLDRIFRLYRHYRTPQKSLDSQVDDERRTEMFTRFFGGNKLATAISLAEWERLIRFRLTGAIDSRGLQVPEEVRKPVGPRTVEGNLRWLKAVLTWATNWRTPEGPYLLNENPVRGFHIPKEKNPKRSIATHERYLGLLAVADQVTREVIVDGSKTRAVTYLPELLPIVNGTGRRISAICQLKYEDLRLSEGPHGSIRWPADTDKMGTESTVPIGPEVRAAIDRVLDQRPGIGGAYLFPSPSIPGKPLRYELASEWLRKAEELAGLEPLDRALWHAFRRKWATERKHLPDVDVAAAGGWSSPATLNAIYKLPDKNTMLRVVLEAGQLREMQA